MPARRADPDPLHRRRRLRRHGGGAVALVVLGAHLGVLSELWRGGRAEPVPPRSASRSAHPVMQSRLVHPAPPMQTLPVSSRPPAREPAQRAAAPAGLAMAAPAAPAAAAPAQPEAAPRPALRLPSAETLHFDARRGARVGSAVLHWQPDPADAGHYRLTLEIDGLGRGRRTLHSEGRVDDAGLAPQRHTDGRQPGALQAANFQREAGKISFSGPAVEFALPAGAQDRVSWIVQLAAIVDADPTLHRPGAAVVFFVAGARGDAGPWRFEVVGPERVDLPAGESVDALHLRRVADRPWGLEAEVWLDPRRQHLPVRLRLATVEGGEVMELWRR